MSPDDTIPLAGAAERYGYSVSTLRLEANRGRLTTYKIGRRLYTRPSDIRKMEEKCRVEPKVPGFTLIRDADNGRSETERASSALAAANETMLRLRNASRNISATSTGQSRQVRR